MLEIIKAIIYGIVEGIIGATSDAEVSRRTLQIEALRKEIDDSSKAVEKTLISDKAKQIIEEYGSSGFSVGSPCQELAG